MIPARPQLEPFDLDPGAVDTVGTDDLESLAVSAMDLLPTRWPSLSTTTRSAMRKTSSRR